MNKKKKIKYFKNDFYLSKNNNKILFLKHQDKDVLNFSKQWKTYRNVQIDSLNNFNLSKKYLKKMLFGNLNAIKNKEVLEIGSGAGRFTEYLVKYAKKVITIDLSDAIFYNVAKNSNKLIMLKANFLKLIPRKKFDIVFCRGVLQHTANPLFSINKLFEFVKADGYVIFDIYKKPKAGFLHPKYLYWRPIFQNFINYDSAEKFLIKKIKIILKIKRILKKILFNSNFFSDFINPIYDYKEKYLDLNNDQIEKWAILDTLDGLYAKYDKPYSTNFISKFLKNKNYRIIKKDKNLNIFLSSL